eukprot:TRINITY_DN192_c2_g1_i1.p1 TRINITY_DN192_c2_g1~~TRINITY_DN192_c2_g1_i1.p1  ORF type:complete len:322 (+),score=49.40 TRINITY_DN192_c2_g1_i1:232-1197(+)
MSALSSCQVVSVEVKPAIKAILLETGKQLHLPLVCNGMDQDPRRGDGGSSSRRRQYSMMRAASMGSAQDALVPQGRIHVATLKYLFFLRDCYLATPMNVGGNDPAERTIPLEDSGGDNSVSRAMCPAYYTYEELKTDSRGFSVRLFDAHSMVFISGKKATDSPIGQEVPFNNRDSEQVTFVIRTGARKNNPLNREANNRESNLRQQQHVASIQLPEFEMCRDGSGKFMLYSVLITRDNNQWKTYCRYKTFVTYYKLLKQRFPNSRVPHLPGKRYIGNNTSDGFVSKRRNNLEQWCVRLLAVSKEVEDEAIRLFSASNDELK